MLSLDFVSEAVVHHVYHIEDQGFKFVAVWFFRCMGCAVGIYIRDLFLYDVGRHTFGYDFFEFIHTEQVVQDNAEAVQVFAFFVLCVIHLVGHFIIFHDGRFAVFEAEYTDSFFRIGLADNLGAADTVFIDDCTDKARISDALQYIIYGEAI